MAARGCALPTLLASARPVSPAPSDCAPVPMPKDEDQAGGAAAGAQAGAARAEFQRLKITVGSHGALLPETYPGTRHVFVEPGGRRFSNFLGDAASEFIPLVFNRVEACGVWAYRYYYSNTY